jgi:hypothetical protein
MKKTPGRNGEVKAVRLRLDSIRLDAGTQTRAHIDDITVAEYAEAMLRGDRFPPVVVFQHDGDFILADGFHRVKAARRAKLKHILAEVRQGARSDALRFALGANHKHGLRRTNADKRRAVEMAIAAFGNLSDHLLADLCGVSQSFVSNIRQQLNAEISSTPRLGKDGKLRGLCRAGVSVTQLRQEADGSGSPNGEMEGQVFIEVTEALAGWEEMLETLVHDHPEKTAAVLAVIAKLRADLLQLEKRLRSRWER